MKWELASKSTSNEIYRLTHNDKKLLALNFHPSTNSARVEYANEKRVLMIRKEGFLRSKTVLRNEYGVRLGQLVHEKSNSSEGAIELGDERFSYIVHNKPLSELVIYRDNPEHPFVVCGLNADNDNPSILFNKNSQVSSTQLFLLLAVCWYMFLPVAKENTLEYAV